MGYPFLFVYFYAILALQPFFSHWDGVAPCISEILARSRMDYMVLVLHG